jgi:DNA polymerase elongation subunit (family B)
MPCLQISASTTAYGRNMIMHTRELVMSMFNKANGYEADCDVIYGDTDSVMVNFGVGPNLWCCGGCCSLVAYNNAPARSLPH